MLFCLEGSEGCQDCKANKEGPEGLRDGRFRHSRSRCHKRRRFPVENLNLGANPKTNKREISNSERVLDETELMKVKSRTAEIQNKPSRNRCDSLPRHQGEIRQGRRGGRAWDERRSSADGVSVVGGASSPAGCVTETKNFLKRQRNFQSSTTESQSYLATFPNYIESNGEVRMNRTQKKMEPPPHLFDARKRYALYNKKAFLKEKNLKFGERTRQQRRGRKFVKCKFLLWCEGRGHWSRRQSRSATQFRVRPEECPN